MRTPDEVARAIELLEHGMAYALVRRDMVIALDLARMLEALRWAAGAGELDEIFVNLATSKEKGDAVRKAQRN